MVTMRAASVLVILAAARVALAQPDPAPAPDPAPPAPDPAPAPDQPKQPDPDGEIVIEPDQPPPQPQQPAPVEDTSASLREANTAATAGDWRRVSAFVDPLLARTLQPAEIAEANRLAGLAAFFLGNRDEAEDRFLNYMRIDIDAHLDPALVPPEAVTFFEDVRTRHSAELRSRRPKAKRYWVLNLVPVAGQVQNGETTKGLVLGTAIGALAITNIATFFVIRSWCHNEGSTCDASGPDHASTARSLKTVNVLSGLGLIATYLYGVYDSVREYRRQSMEQSLAPYASPANNGGVVGVMGSF